MGRPAIPAEGPVLALNCGSSSIKFALYPAAASPLPRTPEWAGSVQGIGTDAAWLAMRGLQEERLPAGSATDHGAALRLVVGRLRARPGRRAPALIAHRVVHGGGHFTDPVPLDDAVLAQLDQCATLAPLHQPAALQAIRFMLADYPDVPQVACFDTAFHGTLPELETVLPLPRDARRRGLRRYGFHGLSYDYVARALAARHGDAARGRTIVAHLGNGASLCAMRGLASQATTMGFSALEGLMMGTRTGSIDPGVLLHLLRQEGMAPERLEQLLYRESGLLGVSGISAEPRVIARFEHEEGERGEHARLALALYVRRMVREIGALAAVLGGLDMLAFTAGIGENSALVRGRVCAALEWLGVRLDARANEQNQPLISAPDSRVRVAVEPTNEEWLIATLALECMAKQPAAPAQGDRS